ncbi:MAG: lactonase family protein [Streptococcaceae bacterium]|nr:lactonase family protein [Streptococcaceae bacterium]
MKEKILLSGYTKRESKGVYSIILDTEKKEISELEEVVSVNGPTYLTVDDRGHLYTVSADSQGNGGTSAFSFDGSKASLLNNVLASGASNCHVSVDSKRHLVYATNYHEGEVRVYKQLADGSLELTDTVKHEDHHGPKPEQKGPLCHFVVLTPDDYLAVCDLGNDSIFTYKVSNDGKLSLYAQYHSAAGSGNRHLEFSHDGKTAYLACELDSTVEVLNYRDGKFELVQKISTLPSDYTGFNGVAAIRLTSDNRFLYVSNRGHDSLAIYAISEAGKHLELIDITKTEGNIPRDFNLAGNDEFILVAHQDSDNLTLFSRDITSGKLSLLQKDFYAPEITCVLPIK